MQLYKNNLLHVKVTHVEFYLKLKYYQQIALKESKVKVFKMQQNGPYQCYIIINTLLDYYMD